MGKGQQRTKAGVTLSEIWPFRNLTFFGHCAAAVRC
jgi:hypothetical protein